MRRFVAFGVALLLALLVAAPASATKPAPGGGTYVVDFANYPRPDGCIPLLVGLAPGETLYGTAVVCQQGQAGTDKALFDGTLILGGEPFEGTAIISFSQTDTWALYGGTGELAGLHGQGTATDDPSGVSGVFEGQFHFDP